MRVKEPTLPLHIVGGVHIGFRSPWLTRLGLWWLGLRGRVSAFESVRLDGVCAKGWVDPSGTTYVTRVWLKDDVFERFCAIPPALRPFVFSPAARRQEGQDA